MYTSLTLPSSIHESWGGSPYEDLVAGMSYITTHLGYVDASRAVALGASYGGYMINWINGHPLGRQFRALVCHDGVFSMANQLSSDEQYFPTHDLGGRFWANASKWDRWDPARFVGAWRTPQLVVHSARDYRLPVSEGLAAFNALQARGVPSRFLTFPDENHWVIGEENSLVWHTVVLNWINGFVGLPPCGQEPEARNPRAKFVEGEGEDEAEGRRRMKEDGGGRGRRTKEWGWNAANGDSGSERGGNGEEKGIRMELLSLCVVSILTWQSSVINLPHRLVSRPPLCRPPSVDWQNSCGSSKCIPPPAMGPVRLLFLLFELPWDLTPLGSHMSRVADRNRRVPAAHINTSPSKPNQSSLSTLQSAAFVSGDRKDPVRLGWKAEGGNVLLSLSV